MVKGTRWAKGGSSESNPKTSKFRDAAAKARMGLSSGNSNGSTSSNNSNRFNSRSSMNTTTTTTTNNKKRPVLSAAKLKAYDNYVESTLPSSSTTSNMMGNTSVNNNTTTSTTPPVKSLEMLEIFEAVQRQMNSPLEHDRMLCAVLDAIKEIVDQDDSLEETEKGPTAYFAAFMNTLEHHTVSVETAIESESDDLEEVKSESSPAVAAIGHLLALVMPKIDDRLFRSRVKEISSLFSRALQAFTESPVATRHLIGCIERLLVVQDSLAWNVAEVTTLFKNILNLCSDERPKPRKRAQDAVALILEQPPVPLHFHPALHVSSVFISTALATVDKKDVVTALHIVALTRRIIHLFNSADATEVIATLLRLLTLRHEYLTISSVEILQEVLRSTSEGKTEQLSPDLTLKLVHSLYDYRPSAQDYQPYISWMKLMTQGFIALARLDTNACITNIAEFFSLLLESCMSERKEIGKNASGCLALAVEKCFAFAEQQIVEAEKAKSKKPVHTIIDVLNTGLTFKYTQFWTTLLPVYGALFTAFGSHGKSLLADTLCSLCALYQGQYFPHKEALEDAVGKAVQALGPRAFLDIYPLEISLDSVMAEFPRGWLLPLFKNNIKHTEIAFFVEYFLPMAARFRDISNEMISQNRALEGKTYSTLCYQVWNLLPGFFTFPTDVPAAFPRIAKVLGGVINSDQDLRTIVCQALQTLINKNQQVIEQASLENNLATADTSAATEPKPAVVQTPEKAKIDLQVVGGFSKQYLTILFNICGTTGILQRGYLLETITSFVSITDQAVLNAFFKTVLKHLLEATVGEVSSSSSSKGAKNSSSMSTDSSNGGSASERQLMMDLALTLISRLDYDNIKLLYRVLKPQFSDEDTAVQKKSYKCLLEICKSTNFAHQQFILDHTDDLMSVLGDALTAASASAKKHRLKCIGAIMGNITADHVSLIPTVIGEVVLCTKEVSEKVRETAFEVLVDMATAMKRLEATGATFSFNDVATPVSISEYIQMIVAGLAGEPHMISATLLALARLIFEFKDDIPRETIHSILSTVIIFFQSKAREVVKSAFGFVKVCLVIMNADELSTHVSSLVTNLLEWSEESRNHFKLKVKVIFERLIRKFGYDAIFAEVPEEHKRLLINMRKIQERAKRERQEKRQQRLNATEAEKKHGMSYDEAMYGSESDSDSDDEKGKGKSKAKIARDDLARLEAAEKPSWIRENAEEDPVDFLGSASFQRVLSTKPKVKKPTDDDDIMYTKDGRMMLKEEESEGEEDGENEDNNSDEEAEYDEEGDMYDDDDDDDMMDTGDGFSKKSLGMKSGKTNKTNKTSKTNKSSASNKDFRSKRGRDDDDDDEEDDRRSRRSSSSSRFDKKGYKQKGGEQKRVKDEYGKVYRSSRAEGDMKRKGLPDPYSYITLDRGVLNRRQAKKSNNFDGIVKAARKGARDGRSRHKH